jgi:glycosyltransferase involved in cell wall biosynthesis
MRICLISREYPPDTGWGGIATFAYHLAQGLSQLGHDVEVVSLADAEEKTTLDGAVRVHRVKPLAILGNLGTLTLFVPYSRYVMCTTSALWRKFLELHTAKPFDVVDTPELLAEGLFPAFTKALPLVIRLYTPHSKFMADQLNNVTLNFDNQLVAMLERIAMLNADAITSPSEDLADFVTSDLNYPRDLISIVRNPIDTDAFSPDGLRALGQTDKLKVLFVGRLEERKGITYLVNAIPEILKACPNTEFIIIGADTDHAKGERRSVLRELKEILKHSNALESTTFISRVPLDELATYYRSADICVVPSIYDNSPYTCLEAMACGRPVIGTTSGGTKEYVTDQVCGIIVPPRDTDALKDAIIRLLKDNALREQMGRNARQRAVEKFGRQHIAMETLSIYETAKRKFSEKQATLYLKNLDHALADASVFMYSLDKQVYDMLYQQSWRFRIRHWWLLASSRPQLLMAKVCLKIVRAFAKLFGGASHNQSGLVAWLEQQVADKQQEPMDILLEAAGRKTSKETPVSCDEKKSKVT